MFLLARQKKMDGAGKEQIKAAAAEKELAVRTAVDEKQNTVDEKEREC